MKEILPGIWRFKGSFSNVYLIREKRCWIFVDVGLASDAKRLLRKLRKMEVDLSSQALLIVPTHLHPDHAGGLVYLARELDALVVLPEPFSDPMRIRSPVGRPPFSNLSKMLRGWREQYKGRYPSMREVWQLLCAVLRGYSETTVAVEFVLPIEDGRRLPFAGAWQVIFTPDHSQECICLYHPERKILISGDTVVYEWGKGEFTFKRERAQMVIARLWNLEVEVILPGHGDLLRGEGVLREILERSGL